MHIDTIIRCIQVSNLNIYQLQRLHEIESKTKYLLPNWNIQEIFGLSDLKHTYGINSDECQEYIKGIERQLVSIGIEKMAEPGEYLDYRHALDWAILNNKERINWETTSKSAKSNGLFQRLKNARVDTKELSAGGNLSLA